MIEYYKIRNWEEFQTYKKPSPKWLMLHLSLLSSKDWILGNSDDRLLLIVCMIIGAEGRGQLRGTVPADAEYVQSRGNLRRRPNLEKLVKSGFLAHFLDPMLANARNSYLEKSRVEKSKEEVKGVDSISKRPPVFSAKVPPKKQTFFQSVNQRYKRPTAAEERLQNNLKVAEAVLRGSDADEK